MLKRTISALILSAAIPVAALAQAGDATQSAPATQAPMASDSNQAQDKTSAQPMEQASASDATTAGPFVTVPESGAWRVSDLQGKEVYGAENESIGQINDVLVSQNGSVNAVIVGVGGFLGIGEKNVAVDISALQLGPGNMSNNAAAAEAAPGVSGETTASTSTATATPNSATPATDGAEVAQVEAGSDRLPERIVLNVTRQQVQDAPEFEGVEAQQ
jgi:sporulation protein YlmC with PRC-barrel domain